MYNSYPESGYFYHAYLPRLESYLCRHDQAYEKHDDTRDTDEQLLAIASSDDVRPHVNQWRTKRLHTDELKAVTSKQVSAQYVV